MANRPHLIATIFLSVVAALLLCAILFPALFLNRAQSFDVMLYSRGLWGLAHFDPYNPVAGAPTLAVHFHLGLLVLAPIARFLNPLTTLILAQAVSFGLMVFITLRAAIDALGPQRYVIAWAGLITLLIITSCWVSNSFLFDVRPDMLAVPLALAGFLRLNQNYHADNLTIVLCLSAVLAREEMGIAVAAGALVAPGFRQNVRRRSTLAFLSLTWWLFYIVWGRQLIGGEIAVERIEGTTEILLGTTLEQWPSLFAQNALNRLQVLLAAGLTLGGAALLGGRWWLAALPGLLWVLVSLRAPHEALHYHYTIFAAPALLTSGVVGFQKIGSVLKENTLVPKRRNYLIIAIISLLLTFAIALEWSSWPGGGRYAESRYNAQNSASGQQLIRAHQILDAAIAPNEGAVLPWSLVAGRAGRSFLWTNSRLEAALENHEELPDELEVVALIRGDAARIAIPLINEYNFRRITPESEPVQVFRRLDNDRRE